MSSIGNIRKYERGTSTVGYALLIGLVAVTVLLSVTRVGEEIKRIFGSLFDETDVPEVIAPEITFSEEFLLLQTGVPEGFDGISSREIIATASNFNGDPETWVFEFSLTSAEIPEPDPMPIFEVDGTGNSRVVTVSIDDEITQNSNADLHLIVNAENGETVQASLPIQIRPFIVSAAAYGLSEPDFSDIASVDVSSLMVGEPVFSEALTVTTTTASTVGEPDFSIISSITTTTSTQIGEPPNSP